MAELNGWGKHVLTLVCSVGLSIATGLYHLGGLHANYNNLDSRIQTVEIRSEQNQSNNSQIEVLAERIEGLKTEISHLRQTVESLAERRP